jgi:hypothetical protein
MINVVAINGSPKAEKSNTEKILAPFLDGMTDAGATIDKYYVSRLNIKPCKGEMACWKERPGVCHIQDDMQLIYPKLRQATILVFATPVYIPLPGEMQNFMNRLVAILEPKLSYREGRTRAIMRPDVNISKIVLVSTSGWWEVGNFGTVLRIVEEFSADASVDFAGALLRPHAREMVNNRERAKQIFAASKQAGFELIAKGGIDKSTLNVISQPLITEDEYWQAHKHGS